MSFNEKEFDARSLVLYPAPFGPAEIRMLETGIRENYARYTELKQAVAEAKSRGDEESPAFFVKLGVCQYLIGEIEDAFESLKRGDGGAVAHFYLGLIYERNGKYSEALREYADALRGGYDDDQCALARARAYRLNGEIDESLRELDRLSGAIESTAEYLSERAATVGAFGRQDEEIALYERAVDADPNCVDALFALALENDRNGNDAEALRCYERAANVFPPRVGVLMNLGTLYEDLGKYEQAQACYERVLKADPMNQRAKLFLKDALSVEIPDERQYHVERKLMRPITDFELSQRPRKCLEALGVKTLGDLCQRTEQELLALSNFGEISLREVNELLAREELKLGGRRPEEPTEEKRVPDELKNRSVDELQLSVRSRKCMIRADVKTIGELARKSADQLMQCKNFGVTSLKEVREKLAELGLSLAGE